MNENPGETGIDMVWLMGDAIYPGVGISLAKMTIAPNVISECHCHSNCTETIHLLEGRIKQRIGDRWIKMQSGDTCHVPANEFHQSQNIGDEPAVLMLAYSSGARIYEAG